jgi:hypothetical protein
MGRAEGSQEEVIGFAMPITTKEERDILVRSLTGKEDIDFAAVSRRSPRGVLELVVSLPQSYSPFKLTAELEELLDSDVVIHSYQEALENDLLMADLLKGQLLLDKNSRWDKLKLSEEEVNERATIAAADLSRRAWAYLESLS